MSRYSWSHDPTLKPNAAGPCAELHVRNRIEVRHVVLTVAGAPELLARPLALGPRSRGGFRGDYRACCLSCCSTYGGLRPSMHQVVDQCSGRTSAVQRKLCTSCTATGTGKSTRW